MPTICFISKSLHYVLLNNTATLIGGAELQQKILAYALAENGWRISVITERINDESKIISNQQIVLYPKLDFSYGNKYFRKLVYLPIKLWTVLNQIDADIYYQRNPDFLSGIIAIFCKIRKKDFVLAGANDWNFDKGKERNLTSILDKISARYAIRNADKLIVQNINQNKLVRSNYKRDSILFRNIFFERRLRDKARHILWVGRIESYKRPRMFLDLARSFPSEQFVMVGGNGSDAELRETIEAAASGLDNVRYLGHQPFEKVEALFDETAIFVNTSIPGCEGFPNTFLQSWSRGIPVVSFFDPDGLLHNENLGVCVDSIADMNQSVEKLLNGRTETEGMAQHIQNFFLGNFSVEWQITKFIGILQSGINVQ